MFGSASTGALAYYEHLDARLGRVSGLDDNSNKQARPLKNPHDKSVNVLLIGSDTRAGQSDAQLAAAGTTQNGESVGTSDTMMIVHVPADNSKVTVLSMPRDSMVTIPSWINPKTGKNYPQVTAKLNASFSRGELAGGNPALTRQTLENLTGLRIDRYMQVDFSGFISIVDALGGVDVNLCSAAKDSMTGLELPAGVSHVNGSTAIKFVRQRHGLAGGDLDRIKRQQYFIGQVFSTLLHQGVMTDPGKLNKVLNAVTSAITVDSGTSLNDLKNLALRLKGLNSGGVVFEQAPVSTVKNVYLPFYAPNPEQNVVVLDQPKLRAMADALGADDAVLAAAAPSDSAAGSPSGASGPSGRSSIGFDGRPVWLSPAGLSVQVYNASGIDGKAAEVVNELDRIGFAAVNAGNAAPRQATEILYGQDRADSARTLAASLTASPSVSADSSTGGGLALYIGTDFAGVAPSAPSLAPSPGLAVGSAASGTGSAGAGSGAPGQAGSAAPSPPVSAAGCAPGGIYNGSN